MKVSPDQILPSQDFLKPQTVGFIFECIQKGELDQLPPDPIVRTGKNGELIAIDGHNLIAVKLHLGEDLEVHVATSSEDGLAETSEANIKRNADLKEKYELAVAERARLHERGIDNFNDLIDQYPDLFNQ